MSEHATSSTSRHNALAHLNRYVAGIEKMIPTLEEMNEVASELAELQSRPSAPQFILVRDGERLLVANGYRTVDDTLCYSVNCSAASWKDAKYLVAMLEQASR